MALITLLNASLAWGDLPLLDEADFSLESGERVVHAPACHRPGIMMAGFHLAERVALISVVAVADGVDHRQALVEIAAVDERCRHLILVSRQVLPGI